MTVFFEYHGNSVKEEIMDNALAENKLLILYTLNQSKLILTKTQFSNIILECMYINYFELQQYIEELIKTGLVLLDVVHEKEAVVISDQGKSVLGMFQDRIPDRKKKVIDTYLTENINHLIRETTIIHEISEGPHGTFQVILSAFENKDELIRISMNVPTKETAEKSVQTWKKESTKIYELLYKELSKKGQ
jgi:predicted transcriptional regulator